MFFFNIKACQHILLHQIHKIMIFKKASYDPFKYDTRFDFFKAIDSHSSHNWWQYASFNIWIHKLYLRLSNVLNCSLFLAERHFYDTSMLLFYFHFWANCSFNWLCWHVSFNNIINVTAFIKFVLLCSPRQLREAVILSQAAGGIRELDPVSRHQPSLNTAAESDFCYPQPLYPFS